MYESEKRNLLRCSEYLVHILRPSYVKGFMTTYLQPEVAERILSEESKSVTSAAQVFLDQVCLLDELGWYQALLDALDAEDYKGLCEALKKWDFQILESTKIHRVLLERIEPSFTKMIKPRDLLLHLGDCLRKREYEEIQAIENQKGPIAAAERLTDCLKRSDKQNWFKLLKSALLSCDLTDALQLLEPDTESSVSEMETGDEEEGETMTTISFQYTEQFDDDDGMLMSGNHLTPSETPPTSATGANSGVGEVQKGGGGEKSRGGEKKMREYQRELAEPVFQGKNTVICAPTGCGKTVVALAICEHHLKVKGKGAKVVFMATKVDVFNQQYKLFQDHFQEKDPDIRINGLCGNQGDQLSMKVVMENNDIIVLTPQILVNAVAGGEITSLSCFSLLILDECHNTTGKHPYNIIMTSYLDAKLSKEQSGQHLPQIVGLTASVGIGSFKNQSEAENNICQLCASLDSRIISTIHTNTDELQSYVHTPEKEFFLVEKRHTDPFIRIIRDIMAKIEGLAKTVYNIESLSAIENRDYGSQKYEQWIVDVQKKCRVLQLKDQEEESRVCRALYNYTEHLRKYNDALIINEDARTKDALDYLSVFIQQVKNAGHDETEQRLTAYFDGQQGVLRGLSSGGQKENPKLDMLQYILEEQYRQNDETKSVLFVRTRALADALKSWIEESDSLKFLKPGVLIGRGHKSSQLTGTRMTLNSKKGVLDSFKSFDNQSKILIATSVADEGIDIPQCNLVLMYEYVGNVVKMVQVRGRGRAQGSKCILVSDKKDRIDKEKHNMEKEKIVEKAIRKLQDTPTEMLRKMEVFQRGDKVCRDMVKMVPERRLTEGSYQLLCSKCKKHSCYTDDIRVLQDSHHIVLDPTLFSRARTEPHPKPKGFMGLVKTKKLFCHCGLDWGIVASYLSIQNLPVLKIESFVVKNCVTEQQRYYRKWRDVTFSMKTFELTDIADSWNPLLEDQ
ncbi:antiviral innate immune response receptor RIG-I [Salmo salar]|uniref:RNA helicase n=1 Tax=Salmo salar TaxID=8030 RepID=C7C1L7_SALSA|nr:probable ATP-dependent RNA helicase DDX58 [Salmo salar]CAX48607.2 retinoic acid-inducible gene-I [Salmo salar]|eukprot:NP_001157171.1 probable ATP-dependent RNA helicase DDX58 [Salmo salar]